MRVVFMGTPEAAVPSLRALADRFEVPAVYTRRDRPSGRGLKVAASPVKHAAEELGLEVVQPRTLRSDPAAADLAALRPDAVAVVAYGMLLPKAILDVPAMGCVNVHFSLLPRWRGAAPIERALLAGDERSGVSTMLMDEGLDTGPVLLTHEVDLSADETSGSLRARLAELAPGLLVRTIEELAEGNLRPRPQDDALATAAPKIDPGEAELRPERTAAELERTVRAMDPAPGAFLWFRERRLKVWRGHVAPGDGPPGTVAPDDELAVQTGRDRLVLDEVQPEGKRRMSGQEFARGRRPEPGEPIGAGPGTRADPV